MNALGPTVVSTSTLAKDAFPASMPSLLLVSAAEMVASTSNKDKDPTGSDAAYSMSSPDEAAASMILCLPKGEGRSARPSNGLSSFTSSLPPPVLIPVTLPGNEIMDDRASKRQQRLMKNRQSAALSRQRKKEYITDLETRASLLTTEKLEMQVGITKLAIQSLEAHQHLDFMIRSLREIRAENEILKQRLALRERFSKGECTTEEYNASVIKSGVIIPPTPILSSVPPSPLVALPKMQTLNTLTPVPLPASGSAPSTPSLTSLSAPQQLLSGTSSSSNTLTSHATSSEQQTKPTVASLRTSSHIPLGVAPPLPASSPSPSLTSFRPAGSIALPPSQPNNSKPAPTRRHPEMIVNILDRPEFDAPPLQRRRPSTPPSISAPFPPPPPQGRPLSTTS